MDEWMDGEHLKYGCIQFSIYVQYLCTVLLSQLSEGHTFHLRKSCNLDAKLCPNNVARSLFHTWLDICHM